MQAATIFPSPACGGGREGAICISTRNALGESAGPLPNPPPQEAGEGINIAAALSIVGVETGCGCMIMETPPRWSLDPQLARDTFMVGDLPLSRVLLMNDASYPWLILVPRQPGA